MWMFCFYMQCSENAIEADCRSPSAHLIKVDNWCMKNTSLCLCTQTCLKFMKLIDLTDAVHFQIHLIKLYSAQFTQLYKCAGAWGRPWRKKKKKKKDLVKSKDVKVCTSFCLNVKSFMSCLTRHSGRKVKLLHWNRYCNNIKYKL